MTQMIENSRFVRYKVALKVTTGCVVKEYQSNELQSQGEINRFVQRYFERFPTSKIRGEVYLVEHTTSLVTHLSNEGWQPLDASRGGGE